MCSSDLQPGSLSFPCGHAGRGVHHQDQRAWGEGGVLEGEDHEGRPQEEEEEPQVKPWPEAPRPPPLPKPHPGPGPRPRGPPPVEEVDQKEDGKEEPEHPALRLPLLE